MVTVAIAGATQGIGSNVLREILATKKHQVVVLSRSAKPDLEAQGVPVAVVDYDSHEQLTAALEGVDTVISCIWSFGPELGSSQLALLAAAKSAGVKRFVPSDWATDRYTAIGAYAAKVTVWDAVQNSGLEYTRFVNGIWMNLWGVGAPKNEQVARAGYGGPPFLVDLKERTALIPGDGTNRVVFTNMRDIGKLVAASLELERWEPDSRIVGDKLSYNEVVSLAEKVTGSTFEKTHVPEDQIEQVLSGDSDPGKVFLHQYMKLIVDGALDFESTINDKFPQLSLTTAEEYLSEFWGNV